MEDVKKWRKGSFTLEAAALTGGLLLVVFTTVFVNFYVHNRAWLTAAAYEAALTGSMEGALGNDAYTAAQERGRLLGNTGFFGLEGLQMTTSAGKKVEVEYRGTAVSAFGGVQAQVQGSGEAEIFRPASFIRKVRLARELGETFQQGD